MGMKIYGPQAPNESPASVRNNDMVVNADGSINVVTSVVTQGSAAEGTPGGPVPAKAMHVGGKDPTGKLIPFKVSADGTLATTTTATTIINSEGTTNTAAPAMALEVGGKDGTGKLQALYVDADGTLHVTGAFTTTGTTTVTGTVALASEGTPGAAAPAKAVEIGGKDGTGNLQPIKTDGTGQVFVTGSVSAGVSGTVTSNQGTENTIDRAWPMKLTDGTDTANINGDGSLNVNITGGTLSSVINANANQGSPNTNVNGWPVKLTDGVDVLGTAARPLRVQGDAAAPVYVSGTTTANQGNPNTAVNGWPVKLTDGTNTASVNGTGALNVAVVSGTITGSNAQGSPNTFNNGWPVKLTDGNFMLGDATHPLIVQTTGTTPVSGSVNATIVNTVVNVQQVKNAAATNAVVTVDASTQIIASNASRKRLIIQNLSINPVYVYLNASGPASSTNFSFVLQGGAAANDGKGGTFIDDTYTGTVFAIAAAGTGNKLVVVEL